MMAVIQPFVVVLDWVFGSILIAPPMPRRTESEKQLVSEQKQFIWHQTNDYEEEEKMDREEEEKTDVNAWTTTAVRPMPIVEVGPELSQALHRRLRPVYFPLNMPPGDLQISLLNGPSGYVQVSGVAETSPLAGVLKSGDVVLYIGGESTAQLDCSALVERLEQLTREGLHVSIVVADGSLPTDTQRELGAVQTHDECIDVPHEYTIQLACGAPSSPDAENAEGEAYRPNPQMKRLPTVDAHELPDPRDRGRFDLFCIQVSAHFCINLLKRHTELDEAVATLSRLLANPSLHSKSRENIEGRLSAVHLIKAKSLKRWGLHNIGDEVTEERLERAVRKKVRRDVAIAYRWDQELAQLSGDAVELKMLEFARFEHLSRVERTIYSMNSSLEEEEPPPPVWFSKKILAVLLVLILVLLPMYYLLLFGFQQGKKTTRAWFIGMVICWLLSALIYEPIGLVIMNVFLPLLIRGKLKTLAEPTGLERFPYKTPLCESPIAFLAHKYQHFVVAHRILRNQQSKTDSSNPRESYAGVSHAHVHTGYFATVNLLVLSAFILLPEEVQGILLDDLLSVCTVLCVMMLKSLKDLTVASLFIAIGMCGILLVIIYACTRGHKSTGRATESVQSTHSERILNRDRTDHEEFLELGHDVAVAHADTGPSGGGRSTQPTDGRVGAPSNSGYFAAEI